MHIPIWIGSLVVVAACAGTSHTATTSDDQPVAGVGAAAGASSGGSNSVALGTSGTGAAGTGGANRSATGVAGVGGTAGVHAIAGNGGQSGSDAGRGAAGQGDGNSGRGGSSGRTGSGGSAGGGGSAGESCDQLETDYATALDAAQMCDAHGTGQCRQLVRSTLGCHCTRYANDSATLSQLQARYAAAGCPTDTCAGVLCVSPGTGTCTPIDRGDVCQ